MKMPRSIAASLTCKRETMIIIYNIKQKILIISIFRKAFVVKFNVIMFHLLNIRHSFGERYIGYCLIKQLNAEEGSTLTTNMTYIASLP